MSRHVLRPLASTDGMDNDIKRGWSYSLVAERMLINQAPGAIPGTTRNKIIITIAIILTHVATQPVLQSAFGAFVHLIFTNKRNIWGTELIQSHTASNDRISTQAF